MPTNILMPQMGESVYEGAITRWLKNPGDSVQKDEPLFEISTDKVDAEIPSPIAGIVTDIRFPAGATVQVDAVVAVVNDAANGTAPTSISEAHQVNGGASASTTIDKQTSPEEHIRCSPLVRRIARENEIDFRQVPASGFGRITKADILRHLAQRQSAGVGGGVAAEGVRVPAAATMVLDPTPTAAEPVEAPAPDEISVPDALRGELVPLTKMRAIIAQRMVESVRVSPHVHTVFKINMTRVVRIREREKARYQLRNGVKLTFLPFIAVAAIQALRKFALVNASIENDSIRYHGNIHLGIAVALDRGLIVPVVKQAEERNFLGLARAISDLAHRARTKRLTADEASGSTFTLTNSGIFGEEFGTPIINQPNSAILAIGGLKKEPLVLTDSEGNDSIAICPMQHFCLGFDHRIIDGADAGRFMSEFKRVLENWDQDIG